MARCCQLCESATDLRYPQWMGDRDGDRMGIARQFAVLIWAIAAVSCGRASFADEASEAKVREAVYDCITSGALMNAGPSTLDNGVPKKGLAPVVAYLCRGGVADRLINAIHGKLPINDLRDHPEWGATVYYLGVGHNDSSSKCVRNERPGANPAAQDQEIWCEIHLNIDPAAFLNLGH